jgi:hypothetical protein
VTNNFDIFKKEYLEANTWAQRKDGVPLDLLDNLTNEELKAAEAELIKAASLRDDWPIVGLGHIKSKDALPTLVITGEFELIDVLYYLPFFKDNKITELLHSYRNHKKYLVAYNATRYLGLPTDEVVEKFRDKEKPKSFWDKLFGK